MRACARAAKRGRAIAADEARLESAVRAPCAEWSMSAVTTIFVIAAILVSRLDSQLLSAPTCALAGRTARAHRLRTSAARAMGRLKVTVKRWTAVASWTWTADDDVCGICHMALDGCAPGAPGPGDDSPVVWGKCAHNFHLLCISTWLQSKTSCPICRRNWEFAPSAPPPSVVLDADE